MKQFIVMNSTGTEGIITSDEQIAYEARKGSDSNCYNEDGERHETAVAFCNQFSSNELCHIHVINNEYAVFDVSGDETEQISNWITLDQAKKFRDNWHEPNPTLSILMRVSDYG